MSIIKIIHNLKHLLESEKLFGIKEIILSKQYSQKKNEINKQEARSLLELLKIKISDCDKCEGINNKKNKIFGDGPINARIMFIGDDSPDENDSGSLPFQGEARKLLTKIIAAMGLTKEDVYITTILKCRTKEHHSPKDEEIKHCALHLEQEIEIVKPQAICVLGNTATTLLLKKESRISDIHGKFFDYNGIKVMPTYHPSYLLKHPSSKKDVWEDMKKISDYLGIIIPLS
ncbi:Phage SPO1 DNA polymerase-related protein [Candidatus Omnitrophus magneticus]|uniref:Type-4 uracil-DNA glycosylase n=1 Tax=Candidatus Omnitrophus magneticus TaxID=1609969 RepID=A0A0F0CSN6_9BACT|nr:Phage SPO1 DNA polymerase-related protein [Candidatus Omnitrophus magneticus]